MKDTERDQLRKTILQFIKKGYVHYTDIEKKTVATCLRFATSNTFRKQFYGYLDAAKLAGATFLYNIQHPPTPTVHEKHLFVFRYIV